MSDMTFATYFCPDRKTPHGLTHRSAAGTAVRRALQRIGLFRQRASASFVPQTAAQARLRAFRTHLALWTLQAWLAMFFVGAAYAKLTEPIDLLIVLLGWPASVDPVLTRAVGVLELVLAGAMVLPLVSWRIGGPITTASAIVLVGLAGCMAILHMLRLEFGFAALNVALVLAALGVAFGRLREFRRMRRKQSQPELWSSIRPLS